MCAEIRLLAVLVGMLFWYEKNVGKRVLVEGSCGSGLLLVVS